MRNESIIQRACEIWWDRRSGACRVNGFMDFVINHADDWYDDCKNLYPSEQLRDAELPELLAFADEYGVRLPERDDDEDDEDYTDRVALAVYTSGAANQEVEVYEWYMLDPWLAEKFAERGEVIYDGVDGPVWGRCCTGQSITMDHIVRDIVREYGEWAVREAGGDPAEVWG